MLSRTVDSFPFFDLSSPVKNPSGPRNISDPKGGKESERKRDRKREETIMMQCVTKRFFALPGQRDEVFAEHQMDASYLTSTYSSSSFFTYSFLALTERLIMIGRSL